MKPLTYICVAVILLSGISSLGEEHKFVSPKQGIPLFLKIVTYDDSFHPDNLDGVTVYVLYDKASATSYEQMVLSREYFREHENLRVSGLSIEVIELPVSQLGDLGKPVDSMRYNLVLVTAVRKERVAELVELCHREKVRSFTYQPDFVSEGVSIGIRPLAKKNKILVNLSSAKAEGSLFSARLLNMCEIL